MKGSNLPISFCSLLVFVFHFLAYPALQSQEEQNSPGPRWGHVLIHNPVDSSLLLFGGKRSKEESYLSDTWVWKNNEWKLASQDGPSGRGFCAATFHTERQSIILHGGRGDNQLVNSDLWEWDGYSWTPIETESEFRADHHQMIYVPNENHIVAFGGWNGEDVSNKTWIWNGSWLEMNGPSPPKRAAFGMAYNNKEHSIILYGGLWINGQYADIWSWKTNQWTAESEPYDNSSLDHHSLIFDPSSNRIIGFGGKNYRYVPQATTFSIIANSIIPLNIEGPNARHSFGFAYDRYSKHAFLYGGKEYLDGNQNALNDFWRWDGVNWERIQ